MYGFPLTNSHNCTKNQIVSNKTVVVTTSSKIWGQKWLVWKRRKLTIGVILKVPSYFCQFVVKCETNVHNWSYQNELDGG